MPSVLLSWVDMIKECIAVHLPHRGVSRPQIKKYVGEKYNLEIGPAQVTQLSKAIISGEEHGIFLLLKGPRGKVELAPTLTNDSSLETKAVPRPFKFKFRKQSLDAYYFSTAAVFISLLADIRNHLLRSQSTRAIYVAMANKFFFSSKKEVRDICKQPTDEDFLSYVRSNWPTSSLV